MLITEYERLCEIIKKGALNDFTYEDFLILREKISLPYTTCVNKKNITIEPSVVSKEDGEITISSDTVMSSIRNVMSCKRHRHTSRIKRVRQKGCWINYELYFKFRLLLNFSIS